VPELYLLDTNTASYIIKGKPRQVRERLLRAASSNIAVSVITEAELRFGVTRRPELSRLAMAVEEFLKRIDVLPWDSDAAKSYAILRATFERVGQPIGNLDLMIAAHALSSQAVLVSSDAVFHRIKQLTVENWIE